MTARIFDNRLSQQWIGFTILHRPIIGATAIGRSQWLRVPPPKVQELAIQLK